ncbi:MAG: HlyD family efflux transporter periplasmic adaptor subunit [Desulfitobacteriaceae bacterium]|nr:HlyD family efflux transporter periplasmic adaptor subunit [Desulfitobacteriaceae bacterium]MDD4346189.1 HlyD family efflux transporter periplasmic adaptor subunit [Desulfitobacteriaceae bacterium]MDD4401172.1 HlyD family efflux transporter periplasmic adaptor subunit [Desulfitobacteriaceae bacterium]
MKAKNLRLKHLLWGMLILAVLFASGLWFYRSVLIGRLLAFAYAQQGEIGHGVKVQATFVNREYVIYSKVAGKVEFLGTDGQRFRRGDIVAKVRPEGAAPGTMNGSQSDVALIAPDGGLLFRKIDGYETFLTAENLRGTNLAELLSEKAIVRETDPVQPGGAAGKIVNNLVPTEAFIEMPSLDNLVIGKSLRFNITDQLQTAKIILKSENPLGIVVQFNQFVDGSVQNRRQEIVWVSQPSVKGVIIPKSSLWFHGEEQGVYVINEGVIQYRKVNILDQDETQVCIEGLAPGMLVVTNPGKGIEGLSAGGKKP